MSEIMLQQTQVDRVAPKYHAFLVRFPDIASLAAAPLADVLEEWSGLGYNRRPVVETSERLARALERVSSNPAGRLIVAHSKGGLVGKHLKDA